MCFYVAHGSQMLSPLIVQKIICDLLAKVSFGPAHSWRSCVRSVCCYSGPGWTRKVNSIGQGIRLLVAGYSFLLKHLRASAALPWMLSQMDQS